MFLLKKPVAIIGFILAVLCSVFCPFLKIPLKGNLNLYQTDASLFFVTIGLIGLAVLFYFMRKVQPYRITTVIYFLWSIISFSLVYFKIHNLFGLKGLDHILSRSLSIQWGWIVLIGSGILLVLSVTKLKEVQSDEK